MELREERATIAMSRAGKDNRGFSLVELLAVVLLLGLASLIAVPSIDQGLRRREVKRSVLELAATARELRRRAIYEGSLQRLTLSPRENSYRAASAEIIQLPAEIRITAVVGGEPLGDQMRQFVFFPNGSILGGAIELSGREGFGYVVRLDPLLGRVVVIRQ